MPLMTWTAALSVGHPEMDRQHKNLMDLVNDLHDRMLSGQANAALADVLDRLVQYTQSHFAAEERLLARAGYPGLASQRAEHQALTQQVVKFRDECRNGRVALSVHVSRFLKDWLQTHIVGEDKKYTAYVSAQAKPVAAAV
jgi:hemerythrin